MEDEHRLRRRSEEVASVYKRLVAETQPRLMHECGGLQRVAGLLAGHLRSSGLAQLGITLFEQRAPGLIVAVLHRFQKTGDVAHARACRWCLFISAVHEE